MLKRVFVVVLILAACKVERKSEAARESLLAPPPASVREQSVGFAAPPPAPPPKLPQAELKPVTRMIIRNANIALVVSDAAQMLSKITAAIESEGGYIADSKQWKEREQVRASMTARVPAAQLTTILSAIRGFAIRVESENVSAQDVSQEFTDLGSQLRNLQAAETELRELLKTVRQRTQKASEIMEVYNEISRVRGEIERLQGRMQYLSQMTALSSITIDLIPDVLAAPVIEPGWQPVATIKAASRALLNSLKGVADVLIWIVIYCLPFAMIFTAIAMMLRATWLRLRRSRRGVAVPDAVR
jgi:uncharacterized protein DUF4349